jgi:hypothetical protein
MIASLTVLQLLLAAPLPVRAGALAQAGDAPAQPGDAAPQGGAAPSETTPPPAQPAPEPPATTPAPAQRRALRPVARPAPARRRLASLQGAETLAGSSVASAWAGWPSFGAAWAMGVTGEDDAGAFGDYDWAKSELRLGGLYRRALVTGGGVGGFDVAFRATLAYYANLGVTWVYSENHSEHGLELGPGIVFSQGVSGGLLSLSADGPLTVTTKYRTGLLFSPRLGVSYEAPLYTGLTLGARAAAGYRAGSGDAPLRTARGEFQFLVLATYELL